MKKYSIIVVCLNAGDKLNDTLRSIFSQNYDDYEVIVKDGGSTDGSIENMLGDNRIRLYTEKDTGIYDAMNQAVGYAQGEFIIFMNCGDKFHGTDVLSTAARYIEAEPDREKLILYGKIYNEKTASWKPLRLKLQALPVIGMYPVINPAFMRQRSVRKKLMTPGIKFVPITSIFSGAITGQELRWFIWTVGWLIMKAAAFLKPRRI